MATIARDTTKQHAARDILLQVVVRVANLALGAIVTALIARTLGQAGYGEWSTLFAVLGMIGYITSFGMDGVVLREAARAPEETRDWVGAVMALRLMVLLPVMLASLIAVLLLERSHEMLVAGVILIAAIPFGGIGTLALLFELRVDNRVPMLVLTIRSILWAAAVYIIFREQGSMIALAIGLALTNGVGALVQLFAALRLDIKLPRPSRKYVRKMVRLCVPVGIATMLIVFYASIDQVIVFVIAGTKEAGLYGAVYNLLDRAHFVPISVLTTLSPVLAASWPGNRPRLLRTARLTAELMMIASLGGLAFAVVASEPVIRLIFGAEFVAAAPALPVLGAAFVFMCLGYLTDNLAFVLDKQRALLRICLIALVINLTGNLAAVPLFGFMGAAWMTLATEVVVFALSLRLILHALELPMPKPGRIGRTVVAAVILTAGLEALSLAGAGLGLLALAAALAYPGLLFGLRAVDLDDVRVLIRRGAVA